jgi:hypothetical protein
MSSTVYFPKTELYPNPRQWDLDEIWEITKDFEKELVLVDELWDERYAKAWCWQHEDETINNEFFLHHMKRVAEADLMYPIILSEEGLIFDGVHRLVKAKYYGMQHILCVRFKKDPLPKELYQC